MSFIITVYTNEGIRYSNKDFTTLESVYEFLDAKATFVASKTEKNITDKYNVPWPVLIYEISVTHF